MSLIQPLVSIQPPASSQAMIYPLHENFAQHSLEITPLVPASETMEEYSDINGDVFHGNNPKNTLPLIDLGPEEPTDRSRRAPFKDPQVKAQTAQTRKDNACLRCRMQRIRVGCT
jgi:hypothetical protein